LKKILILTAGFGEGHNSAARGIRAALLHLAPETCVELHDLFSNTYGVLNDWARTLYLSFIDRRPAAWGVIYRWLDRERRFSGNFKVFFSLKHELTRFLARFRPDVIVSVYPAYPHMLDEMLGPAGDPECKRVVVVTDSLSVNGIWYRCSADYFLLPNEASAAVLWEAGIPRQKTRAFGFPVSPHFAELNDVRAAPSDANGRRVLYIVNALRPQAPELVRRLAAVGSIELTVTTGRDKRLFAGLERLRQTGRHHFNLVSWSDDLPRLLRSNHLVISKAGGATVQEALAGGCPMIVNHVIPGQEEGNARLMTTMGCGMVALSRDAVVAAVQQAFANDATLWRSWAENVRRISRPAAALETAGFLLSL
jgi:processive 1,2-diacylglycerol beta-glucosyltransferase